MVLRETEGEIYFLREKQNSLAKSAGLRARKSAQMGAT
jgi:hypothetical protein